MTCYKSRHLRDSAELEDAWRAARARIGRAPTMRELAAELVARKPDNLEHYGQGMVLCGDLGPRCAVCGDVSDLLCDYPVGEGKTCDRALCSACTEEVALDVHYCPGHLAEFRRFEAGGGVRDKLGDLVPFRHRRR